MATNEDQRLFQCSTCQSELDMESKTLTCLHSLCGSCLNKVIQGETNGNGQCPECQQMFKIDQSTLSPVLVNSLKCRQMELTKWKCDLCLEDGKDSMAKNWCHGCVKFFCENCNRFHQKLHRKHNSVELDENGKDEVRKSMRTNLCKIHNKVKESYCKQCNVCLCDTCYTIHLNDSPQCPPHPISVRKEAFKKEKHQGPTLLKEISDLENDLRERNKKYLIYSEQLERECLLKCKDIWLNYEETLKEMREKMHEMCEELRRLKSEQVKKWRQLMAENERMLKKLEIWSINLRYLLKKEQNRKADIVCGVELVGTKLASLSGPHPQPKISEPVRKCELVVKFSSYYLQFLEGLKNQMMGSCSLNYSEKLIRFENELSLPGSNPNRYISSIVVNQNDNHMFLADWQNNLIIELSESGQLVCEFPLTDELYKYSPEEMFFSSPEMLVVNCFLNTYNTILFLQRKKKFPFLKIRKKINPNIYCYSLCQIEKTILICWYDTFTITCYTEKGEFLKTIETGIMRTFGGECPLIRADPSTSIFFGTTRNTCNIHCFNEKGQVLQSFETKKTIWDFSLNEFGEIYFCNSEGIFLYIPEKNLHKKLHNFKIKSKYYPNIFISREKMFVSLQRDGQYFIKIFKFLK